MVGKTPEKLSDDVASPQWSAGYFPATPVVSRWVVKVGLPQIPLFQSCLYSERGRTCLKVGSPLPLSQAVTTLPVQLRNYIYLKLFSILLLK